MQDAVLDFEDLPGRDDVDRIRPDLVAVRDLFDPKIGLAGKYRSEMARMVRRQVHDHHEGHAVAGGDVRQKLLNCGDSAG